LNNISNENGNNNSLINLINDMSQADSQKDKHTTLSKNSEDFPQIEYNKINIIPLNNLGK